VANATENTKLVNFETHAWTTAITKTTATKVALEVFFGNGKACGETFHDHRKRLTVGFTCS
jgi:hypothetical protein